MTTTAPAPPAVKSYSALQMSMRRLVRHKAAMISLAFIVLVLLTAIFAPLIAPHDPNAQDLGGFFAPPSASYPLGQDELGRDLLSRIFYGGRISLVVGFSVAIISVLVGTLVGLMAGYFGGLTDSAISRFIEFMLSLPTLPLQLTISGLFAASDAPFIANLRQNLGSSASVVIIITIFSVFGWMGTARLVRGEVLRLKNLEYVDAARALGANNNRVMWRHLAPNMLGIIVVSATIDIAGAILGEAALSFLGFGIQPPVSTWGNMLSNAQEVVLSYPWLPFYPGLMILFTVLAFNFLGDGLRDAFDPKGRR
ncbi:ABC transporter permease [Deinococcus arenicola]|uniref:ABC transporter permease n=1 Tax=Deinococcus arenicola TaxID=2994950 RepID=A0ABU4DUG4_9DEIO|nr:ABC transporter permease [Deinococcus sp. ZS9-10]MDV6376066.1 ABC transporter permease [Deinococcus sp. ZS9-10]